MSPRIALDQWNALVAVVESGGYAGAANRLHRTQSTITYTIKKLEEQLGLKVFELQGRKAALTPTGQLLYPRGKALLAEAVRLERSAAELAPGQEPQIRLAVDVIYPTWLLLDCLKAFADEQPDTRIELYETVLGGTDEALIAGAVDLAIGNAVPGGFLGDALMQMRFVCAAAPEHPLHALGRAVTLDDLRAYRHLVVRDSGVQRTRSVGWLNVPYPTLPADVQGCLVLRVLLLLAPEGDTDLSDQPALSEPSDRMPLLAYTDSAPFEPYEDGSCGALASAATPEP